MERSGFANLPLHPGHAPRWLFGRMVNLSKEIVSIIALEYGTEEVLRRFADPYWFQAFSCVIGFDWHSSGTTTVTMGALKQALRVEDGLVVVGGKGRISRSTPLEIEKFGYEMGLSSQKIEEIKYASKMAAKVDNTVLQDGYPLYHHTMLLDEHGNWVVIQQGMNSKKKYARRYHWLHGINSYVNEPRTGIIADSIEAQVLDMSARVSEEARKISVDVVRDNPKKIRNMIADASTKGQKTLDEFSNVKVLTMPWHINWNTLFKAYEIQPKNYEELIGIKGIGPSTVRALAYIAEIIYGAEVSWKDPVKYSFALGGKDGVPKPVDRKTYDNSIEILQMSIEEASLGRKEKLEMLRRLRRFVPP
ncbi:hypothetical protein AciM339_0352 [Aciduliprofundum sp. MAR08-339]|uniref:DUF763 domain-containing protein n=1 Tax=Aciduliprofundum sp. (strain MAR08-339) TaxID=673860 RepID=UPI0002A4CEA5|nr:hypothetical protein AciM339_0352 [Aciduliprofundum sp. MAR08-339]